MQKIALRDRPRLPDPGGLGGRERQPGATGKLPGAPRGGRAAPPRYRSGTVPTLTGQHVQTQPECALAPPSSASSGPASGFKPLPAAGGQLAGKSTRARIPLRPSHQPSLRPSAQVWPRGPQAPARESDQETPVHPHRDRALGALTGRLGCHSRRSPPCLRRTHIGDSQPPGCQGQRPLLLIPAMDVYAVPSGCGPGRSPRMPTSSSLRPEDR